MLEARAQELALSRGSELMMLSKCSQQQREEEAWRVRGCGGGHLGSPTVSNLRPPPCPRDSGLKQRARCAGHPRWPGIPLPAGCTGQRQPPTPTHVASAQMFLWPQKGRRTVAKALPWLNISVTWEGK